MILWIIFSKSGKSYARRLVGVVGSNPTWGAIFVVRKSYKTQKAQGLLNLVLFCSHILWLTHFAEYLNSGAAFWLVFQKNRTWTGDLVLIPAWHQQFNTNFLRENKDKRSLFFYAVSRGDFLFAVRKIIITVNRKEFSMKYKEWLDVWFANYIEPSSKTKTCERYSEIIEKHLNVKLGEY